MPFSPFDDVAHCDGNDPALAASWRLPWPLPNGLPVVVVVVIVVPPPFPAVVLFFDFFLPLPLLVPLEPPFVTTLFDPVSSPPSDDRLGVGGGVAVAMVDGSNIAVSGI